MMGVMVAYGVDISCALKYNSLKSIINNSFKLGKFESCVIYGIITQDLVRDHVPLRVPIRKLVEYLDSIGNERFKNSAIKHLLSMITMTFDTHRIKFYHKNIRDMLFLIMCIRYRLTKQRQALPENKIVYNFDILPCELIFSIMDFLLVGMYNTCLPPDNTCLAAPIYSISEKEQSEKEATTTCQKTLQAKDSGYLAKRKRLDST